MPGWPEHGRRPTAGEAFRAGYNPRQRRDLGSGSLPSVTVWIQWRDVVKRHGVLLADVATTSMTKSYKMVALRAFCDAESLM